MSWILLGFQVFGLALAFGGDSFVTKKPSFFGQCFAAVFSHFPYRDPQLPAPSAASDFQGSSFVMETSVLGPRFSFREISDEGFRRVLGKNRGTLAHFERDPSLLTSRDPRLDPPPFLAEQRQRLDSLRSSDEGTYPPSRRERLMWDFPESEHILTANSISRIPEGKHAFVLLEGETFLRLGVGHPRTGGGWRAVSAGEVEIRRDSKTGERKVVALNPRSDTYRPDSSAMVPAVEALWSQGIFPRELKIFEWNHQDLVLDLTVP